MELIKFTIYVQSKIQLNVKVTWRQPRACATVHNLCALAEYENLSFSFSILIFRVYNSQANQWNNSRSNHFHVTFTSRKVQRTYLWLFLLMFRFVWFFCSSQFFGKLLKRRTYIDVTSDFAENVKLKQINKQQCILSPTSFIATKLLIELCVFRFGNEKIDGSLESTISHVKNTIHSSIIRLCFTFEKKTKQKFKRCEAHVYSEIQSVGVWSNRTRKRSSFCCLNHLVENADLCWSKMYYSSIKRFEEKKNPEEKKKWFYSVVSTLTMYRIEHILYSRSREFNGRIGDCLYICYLKLRTKNNYYYYWALVAVCATAPHRFSNSTHTAMK